MTRRTRLALVGAILLVGSFDLLLTTDPGRRALVVWMDDGYAWAGGGAPHDDPGPPAFDDEPAGTRDVATLFRVADGPSMPTDLVLFAPDQGLLATKGGDLHCVDLSTGALRPGPHVAVETASELGLLGLALHPDYPSRPLLYVSRTVTGGAAALSQIVEHVVADPTDPCVHPLDPGRVLLEVNQPYANHNGGQIRFDPKGFLVVGFGDGGFRADPHHHGQARDTWLGKLLRIDVSPQADGRPYGIPADNPFVGNPSTRPEIAALGLRNPWRFDVLPDGSIVVGDVGQDTLEELDHLRLGANLGWSRMEATRCFEPTEGCEDPAFTAPSFSYGRKVGTSITGGIRVDAPGPWQGSVVFGDFSTGRLWRYDPGSRSTSALGRWKVNPVAFARDSQGRALVLDARGVIWRVTPG